MASNTTVPTGSTSNTASTGSKSGRLYYLDWLRVILLFGVFIYHVLRPFDMLTDWHINNAERSAAAMGFMILIINIILTFTYYKALKGGAY